MVTKSTKLPKQFMYRRFFGIQVGTENNIIRSNLFTFVFHGKKSCVCKTFHIIFCEDKSFLFHKKWFGKYVLSDTLILYTVYSIQNFLKRENKNTYHTAFHLYN